MTSSGKYTVSETARAAGISRQAYYKWLNHRLSLREQQEREVLEEIKRIEKRHQDSVGYDKMVRLLNRTIPLRVDTLNNKSVISRGCFE
ncbi:hypothetical protein [Limosilactobacillus fermentum]|uniref:hypothetical protein n=1 Tax=Limosilactobacillus fermentum TaxID=1613 RepID=UPI00209ADAFB|nr:hypothetical protein [Limosilactobacillus fermentum]